MRLLVTGAGGMIGRHVAAAAASRQDIQLVATARSRPADLPESAEFHPADLSNPDSSAALIRSVAPTHVIHAAWESRRPTYWEDLTNLDWVVSAARMAAAFAEIGGRRFVQVGSCAEYDWSHGLCVESVTPDQPATRYGKAKLAAFRAVEAAAHRNFEAVEARIFFVFGPGEDPARFIPLVCRAHLDGRVPELGSGRQWRDLLHAEDAARAVLAVALARSMTGTVNVGAGVPTSLAEVAGILADIAGATETGLGRRADREDEPIFLVASSERLRETGWAPQLGVARGLAQTFDWWRGRADGSGR